MQVVFCGPVQVVVSSRSSITQRLLSLRDQIKCIAEHCGAYVAENEIYPGWSPNPQSALVKLTKQVYVDKFWIEPKVTALHAGLEVCTSLCGLQCTFGFHGFERMRCGASVDYIEFYPGWSLNPGSALAKLTKQVDIDKFGIKPKVTALHAGLEVCTLVCIAFLL
jgi:di/tripeptidase